MLQLNRLSSDETRVLERLVRSRVDALTSGRVYVCEEVPWCMSRFLEELPAAPEAPRGSRRVYGRLSPECRLVAPVSAWERPGPRDEEDPKMRVVYPPEWGVQIVREVEIDSLSSLSDATWKVVEFLRDSESPADKITLGALTRLVVPHTTVSRRVDR